MTRIPSQPQSWIGHTRPRSAAEKRIVDHINYWNQQTNQNWRSHNFFENGTVHAGKLDVWGAMCERPQSAVSSLVSTRGIVNPDDCPINYGSSELTDRRRELRAMLAEETSSLHNKIHNKCVTESTSAIRKRQLQLLREKQQKIKSKKEAERKERAARLMYEQFKKNCPELRGVETKLLQDHVKTVWKDQLDAKSVREAEDEHKKRLEKEHVDDQVREEEEKQKQAKLNAIAQKQAIAETLELQLGELREREAEKLRLTQEQERLMLEADTIREFQETQRQALNTRVNKKYAKLLWRQWRAQLRQRAIERRKELEEDAKILEKLEAETARDLKAQKTKRSELVDEVKESLATARDRIRREKDLEFKLDLMVREQGEKVWEEREKLWATERQASQKLLEDVLNYREKQISERRSRNLQAQDDLIKEREDLLAQIEHIASETSRDQIAAIERQEALKRDREDEIEYKKEVDADEELASELDQVQRRQRQQEYETVVAEEKARLMGEKYTERVFPRPTSRPTTSQSVRFEEPAQKWSESRPSTAHSTTRPQILKIEEEKSIQNDKIASERPTTADSAFSTFSRVTGPFIY